MFSKAIKLIERAWTVAPIATVLLTLAIVASMFFGVRSATQPMRVEREQSVAAWMTPRYVARSWGIPPEIILSAIDVPKPRPKGPYLIGRTGGSALAQRLARSPARATVLEQATDLVDQRGGLGVFLSTWAVAPLGPWVNFIAGATGLSWLRFSVWDVLGETVWVVVYVGLGYAFMDQITIIAEVMSVVIGFVVALVLVVVLAMWIRAVLRSSSARILANEDLRTTKK